MNPKLVAKLKLIVQWTIKELKRFIWLGWRGFRYHPWLFFGSSLIAGGWIMEKLVVESSVEAIAKINKNLMEFQRREDEQVENSWRIVNMKLHDSTKIGAKLYHTKYKLAVAQELIDFLALQESAIFLQNGDNEDSVKDAILEHERNENKVGVIMDNDDLTTISDVRDAYHDWYLKHQQNIKIDAAIKTHQLELDSKKAKFWFIFLVALGTFMIQINNAQDRERGEADKNDLLEELKALNDKIDKLKPRK